MLLFFNVFYKYKACEVASVQVGYIILFIYVVKVILIILNFHCLSRPKLRGLSFLANILFIFTKMYFELWCHSLFLPEHKFYLQENMSLVIVFDSLVLIQVFHGLYLFLRSFLKAAILNVNSCDNILARSISKYFFCLEFLWLGSRMT